MLQSTPVDIVMRALADPTRRAVFERIAGCEEINVADLTRASGVTQSAVSQHLKLLKRAGLVAERPQGRNVFYRAKPEGVAPLSDWLRYHERFWTDRVDALERLLRAEDARESPTSEGDQK